MVGFGLQLSAFLQQQLHHRLVPIRCSPRQRRPTIPLIFGLQLSAFLQQQLHHRLVPITCSPDSGVRPLLSLEFRSCPFSSKVTIASFSPKYAAKCGPVICLGTSWLYFESHECSLIASNAWLAASVLSSLSRKPTTCW